LRCGDGAKSNTSTTVLGRRLSFTGMTVVSMFEQCRGSREVDMTSASMMLRLLVFSVATLDGRATKLQNPNNCVCVGKDRRRLGDMTHSLDFTWRSVHDTDTTALLKCGAILGLHGNAARSSSCHQ
jgi:hypothetical protein